jgi:preprotein translocase subunit YajC
MSINTLKVTDPNIEDIFSNRLGFVHQINIARKFNDKLSLQLTPSFVHRNLVAADDDNDENATHLKYGDKVLQVSGDIAELSVEGYQVSITLNDEMEGVNCSLDSIAIVQNKELINQLKLGDKITLKGKCDGFDMIMGVVLTRCYIIK